MKCKHCGNEIADGSKFCKRCGNKVTHANHRLFFFVLFALLLVGGCIGVYYGIKNSKVPVGKVTITVDTNDSTMGTVNGGGECARYDTITIEAVANMNYRFVSWDDGCEDRIRQVVADHDKKYLAQFEVIIDTLTQGQDDITTVEPKVEPKEEPKVEPKEEPKVEPKEEPKVEPKEEPKIKEKKYWFGRYEGDLKNGIPEGRGVMYYNCHVQIAKHDIEPHYAEKGDYFDGVWSNGDIEVGELYNGKGELKYHICPGARTQQYELNDGK